MINIVNTIFIDVDMYGIDWNGPLPFDESDTEVVVPECICLLTDDQLEQLYTEIPPTSYFPSNAKFC